MLKRVRLGMEALEAREVPAAFSFRLADGTVGSGRFSTPAGVDAAQATQSIGVADLTVSLGGEAYTVQGGATASYAYGVLTGVTATATGPGGPGGGDDSGPPIGGDDISLSGATATVGTASATVAYDAADTRATFELSDGTGGTLSYDIPWDAVDATQASQSVSLSNFVLNIAGQNLTPATATFTTSPSVQFAHGVLTGITFAIDTSGLAAFPYVAVSMSGLQASAQPPMIPPALPGLPPVVPPPAAGAVNAQGSIYLDFSAVTTGQAYRIDIDIKNPAGTTLVSGSIQVGAGLTASEIRNLVANLLGASGLEVEKSGGHRLFIGSKGGTKLGAITYTTYIGQLAAPGVQGPKVGGKAGDATLTVNGTTINP